MNLKRSDFFRRLDTAVEDFKKTARSSEPPRGRSLEAVVASASLAGLLSPSQEATENNPIIRLIRFLEKPDGAHGCMTREEYRLNEAAWDYYVELFESTNEIVEEVGGPSYPLTS